MKEKQNKIEKKCIVCKKEIRCTLEQNLSLTPSGAIICYSKGNYGSTLYDTLPHENESIRFLICDECLKDRAAFVDRLYGFRVIETFKVISLDEVFKEEEDHFAYFKPARKILKRLFGDNYKHDIYDVEDKEVRVYFNDRSLKDIKGWIGRMILDKEWRFELNEYGKKVFEEIAESYPEFKEYFRSQKNG